jgi:hypothetical protein
MNFRVAGLAGLALFVVAGSALAHHSNAMFDFNKSIQLTGTVKTFEWTNPHSWVHLVVTDSRGKVSEYAFEMGGPSALVTHGWKPKTIVPGDKVTVLFYPTKEGGKGGSLRALKLADGKVMGEQVKF